MISLNYYARSTLDRFHRPRISPLNECTAGLRVNRRTCRSVACRRNQRFQPAAMLCGSYRDPERIQQGIDLTRHRSSQRNGNPNRIQLRFQVTASSNKLTVVPHAKTTICSRNPRSVAFDGDSSARSGVDPTDTKQVQTTARFSACVASAG